jgi:carboxypeptidase family protein/TonB-dependent receptor-like protein
VWKRKRLGVVLFWSVWPLLAQVDRASLNGTVTDVSGAMIPRAKVAVTSPDTGFRRQTLTGSDGSYNLPGLPIGSYNITVTAPGFEVLEAHGLKLAVGQAATYDARLSVGTVKSEVEVSAAAVAVDRTSAEVSGVVSDQQVRSLPLNGREWGDLMLLVPGAIDAGNGNGGDQRNIRFAGRSRDDNNYTFDGIDNSGVQEQAQKANTRLGVSLDAVAEFRVSSAVYTAESGATGGGQINVVSKTGGNAFHGGGFEYYHNDAMQARGPFGPPTLPPLSQNQFGGNFGGPIKKNKTFFFANYEAFRSSTSSSPLWYVPSAAFRQKVTTTSPALKPIIDAYPTPASFPDPSTIVASVNADMDSIRPRLTPSEREDSGMIRVDHRFTDSTTMFVRYNVDDRLQSTPGMGITQTLGIRPQNAVIQLQHIFSPKTVNEVKFGINRQGYHNDPGTLPNGIPSITGMGFTDLGATGNALDVEDGTTWNYVDNLTVVRGHHTLKFGIEVRRIQLNNSAHARPINVLTYTSDANFANNQADNISIQGALPIGGMRRTFWMGYAQDEIKLRPDLTVNLGMRYEYYTVMHEILGRYRLWQVQCGGFCPPGTPYYQPDPTNFAPRVGLAWSPAVFHGKTTIRTGFGVYWGAGQNDDYSPPHESIANNYSLSTAVVPNLSYPIEPFLGLAASVGVSPGTIDPNLKPLYYENWDFDIAQQMPRNFLLTVGYQGSEGHNLLSPLSLNRINPLTGTRPFPQFAAVGQKTYAGNSNFHALQVGLTRSFKNGFLWQTHYQWSKAITDASVGAGETVAVENQSCRACDRSRSPFDVPHNFVTSVVYQLPFGTNRRFLKSGLAGRLIGGWDLSGIGMARDGLPVNIVVTRSASALPDGVSSNQRPNLVPGISIIPAGGQTISQYWNIAAFSVPAAKTWGNLGRYAGRGPGFYTINSALEKKFPVTERLSGSFRIEAFNLFNHAILNNPAANIATPATFGRITGSSGQRNLQLMFRVEF